MEDSLEEQLNALNDPDLNKRLNAMRILGHPAHRQNKMVLQALIQATSDSDKDIRFWAIDALGQLHSKGATSTLIKILSGSEAELACAAASALGKIHSRRAISPLLRVLNSDNNNLVSNAIFALGELGEPKIVDLIVTDFLYNEDSDIKRTAVRVLGTLGNESHIELLLPFLEDKNSLVQSAVLRVLRGYTGPNLIAPLINFIESDASEAVREETLEILGYIPDQQTLSFLISYLSNERAGKAAAKALKKMGEMALPELLKATFDENLTVRWNAIYALGISLNSKALPRLLEIRATGADKGKTKDGKKLKNAVENAIRRINQKIS